MSAQTQLNLPVVADVDHAIDISQIQRRQARAARKQQLLDLLDAIYSPEYGSEQKEMFDRLWADQQALWLSQLPSAHTRRAYANALGEFKSYMWTQHAIKFLWLVEPRHAVLWLDFMRTVGNAKLDDPKPLSDRTANLRLAAMSSFYEHMTAATKLVQGDQVGLFVSADGHPRQNPFRSRHVKRPKVVAYGHSNPVPQDAIRWILRRLAAKQNKSLADIRDHAILTTFAFTGYRADSVLSMRWADFQPRTDGDGMTFYWRGKGGKERRKALPARVWNAITAYLKADGRYMPGHITPDDDMVIWQAVRRHGMRNLAVQRFLAAGHQPDDAEMLADEEMDERTHNRPIAQSSANGILRRHLRRYYIHQLRGDGMPYAEAAKEAKRLAADYHLHSLRHTFANAIDQTSDGDIRLVSELLDHSSIQTTRTYLEAIRDPEDKATALLEQAFGL
ncbi:MAG: tyrosine-type recombinase/integrase [Caldilineaceae bacterium]|nr:tyrosine-type recombinase/integrase [Caldilineaceae bacterium]